MVANILYSDRVNATLVKCHLVAFNPGGNYQGNRHVRMPTANRSKTKITTTNRTLKKTIMKKKTNSNGHFFNF